MKFLIKDEHGQTYDVLTEDGYIVAYTKNLVDYSEKLGEPTYRDSYWQIEESLPSRFDAWLLSE